MIRRPRGARLVALLGPAVLALLMLAACNALIGLDQEYILLDGDVSAPQPDGPADMDTGSSSADGSNDTSTTTTDAPSVLDADAATSSGDVDATNVVDATTDTGPPPPPKLIHCGATSTTCDIPNQKCCSTVGGGYHCPSTTDCVCIDAGSSCSQPLDLECDDETDCTGGFVCCGLLSTDRTALQGASCLPASSCPTSTSTLLCDFIDPKCRDAGPCHAFIASSFPGIGRCSD